MTQFSGYAGGSEGFAEPTDVGPLVGGDVAVTADDRDHVVTLLQAACNEGRIAADDRDRRVERARAARTFDDLIVLTRDLVPPDRGWSYYSPASQPTAGQALVGQTAQASPAVAFAAGQGGSDFVVAIMSGTKRRGEWNVKPTTYVVSVCGGADLDLTRARFEAKEVRLNVLCLCGGVDVKVPRGVEVRTAVVPLFGGANIKNAAPVDPSAPVVVISGLVMCGGLKVKYV
ncbi:MAG: cell wall-active antibiotics response protein [Propionibacteriaceae bacterium]|jgi:hypothetical protein|nr:cell wall-active antibiotics response protein [Propionibacteriaceae bacterium]